MNNAVNNIKYGLLKRQEALKKFNAGKEKYLLAKAQIINDIEEARNIWRTTLEQFPNLPFS
jgi:hypothetical protein